MHSPLAHGPLAIALIDSTQTAEVAVAINASLQFAIDNRLPPYPDHNTQTSEPNNLNGWASPTSDYEWNLVGESSPPKVNGSSGWIDELTKEQYYGWGLPEPKHDKNKVETDLITAHLQSSGGLTELCKEDYNGWGVPVSKPVENNTEATYMPQSKNVPFAPPIPMEGLNEGSIQYLSIDLSPVDLSVPCLENDKFGMSSEVKYEGSSSSCMIFWEAPVEGASVLCGHMAGCMAYLDEVKT